MTQDEAFEILKLGKSVFITGPAGSGKTFLLNKYVSFLKSNGIGVSVTASTGIAATHIGGITIHSWCGMGIDKQLSRKEFRRILGKKYLRDRMAVTRVLIIDEISMLDADRLDLVDTICRAFKNDLSPFGGLQVVLCGDFFQLPPVSTRDEVNKYAFESSIWKEMEIEYCYLDGQYRHSDKQFIKILNNIRNNNIDVDTVATLEGRIGKMVTGKIVPTKLYSRNSDVNAINTAQLSKIVEKQMTYTMKSTCRKGMKHLLEYLVKNCMSPEKLDLKEGAVVMFVKNKFDDYGFAQYVNGTLGKVIGFNELDGYPVVETLDGRKITAYPRDWSVEEGDEVVAKITQVPLRLAWAITVHKSQGMSLDEAVIDLRTAFDYGMGYVALSRVRTLEGIELLGLNQKSLQVNPDIVVKDKEFAQNSAKELKKFAKLGDKEVKKRQKAYLTSISGKDRINLFDGTFS